MYLSLKSVCVEGRGVQSVKTLIIQLAEKMLSPIVSFSC